MFRKSIQGSIGKLDKTAIIATPKVIGIVYINPSVKALIYLLLATIVANGPTTFSKPVCSLLKKFIFFPPLIMKYIALELFHFIGKVYLSSFIENVSFSTFLLLKINKKLPKQFHNIEYFVVYLK